jgi:PKHD-type hydroxylase
MILKNYNWIFESANPKKICYQIIELGKYKKKQLAGVGLDDPSKITSNLNIRKSMVAWANDQWIYKEIIPFIETANKNAEWNFKIDWYEDCQITEYNKGQFYNWHPDMHENPYPEGHNFSGKTRKISASILLNDSNEFRGGDLEFQRIGPGGKIIKNNANLNKIGTIIVFPSFIYHRVKPVTKGKRHSLVIWGIGNSFI